MAKSPGDEAQTAGLPAEDRISYWNPGNIENFPGRRLGSVFANRFQFLLGDDVTRIVFGQSLVGEEDATWLLAVSLPREVVMEMARALLEVEAAHEENLKKQAESEGKGGKS